MCELFGVSAAHKVNINGLLKDFFSHSVRHRNGWGLAFLDDGYVSIEKEPALAAESLYLKHRLQGRIETARCMAHIRNATIGDVKFDNTHPFSATDEAGRRWVLVHNGTIFESRELSPYQYRQVGSSDSERILLYIVDQINKSFLEERGSFDVNERIRVIEEIILRLVPGNKLNILLYDGDYFYVHKNEPGTLFKRERDKEVIFSTNPLEKEGWKEIPQNRLLVYRDGELVYTGERHGYTYVYDPEKMKMLYLECAGL